VNGNLNLNVSPNKFLTIIESSEMKEIQADGTQRNKRILSQIDNEKSSVSGRLKTQSKNHVLNMTKFLAEQRSIFNQDDQQLRTAEGNENNNNNNNNNNGNPELNFDFRDKLELDLNVETMSKLDAALKNTLL
jgi:hypothetical protein